MGLLDKVTQRALDTYKANILRSIFGKPRDDSSLDKILQALRTLKARNYDARQALSDSYVTSFFKKPGYMRFVPNWDADSSLFHGGRLIKDYKSNLIRDLGYPNIPFQKVLK